MIETERLILRRWRAEDRVPFAALNASAEVCEFLPKQLTREESDAFAERIDDHFEGRGFGLFAVERKDSSAFIGFTGLAVPRFEAPFMPAVEIGWRLDHAHWGEGFAFKNSIVGGSVPKQYIPAVEEGVKDFMRRGPLGFEVVDVAVELCDGSAHAVDSSDMAFKTAARMAMNEGLPKCKPVLLEPIQKVVISVPNDATARVQRIITGRRGQILGFQAKEDWSGWDEVEAYLPESETRDLIIEIRSHTGGIGFYDGAFDHLAELTGRIADQVVEGRTAVATA